MARPAADLAPCGKATKHQITRARVRTQRQQQEPGRKRGAANAAFGGQLQLGHLRQGQHAIQHFGKLRPRPGRKKCREGQAPHLGPGQFGQRHAGDAQPDKALADPLGHENLLQHICQAARVQVGPRGDRAIAAQGFPIGADLGRAARRLRAAAVLAGARKRKSHRSLLSES
ncbi:hypothetical protein MASR1M32_21200 [Rhodobacter sp.]